MSFCVRLPHLFAPVAVALSTLGSIAATAPQVGTFFETDQPFFQAQVQVVPPAKGDTSAGNFVVRGLLLPLASGHCVVFDQELMRVAGVWKMSAQDQPVTPMT